jgi:hypothetical protein
LSKRQQQGKATQEGDSREKAVRIFNVDDSMRSLFVLSRDVGSGFRSIHVFGNRRDRP